MEFFWNGLETAIPGQHETMKTLESFIVVACQFGNKSLNHRVNVNKSIGQFSGLLGLGNIADPVNWT